MAEQFSIFKSDETFSIENFEGPLDLLLKLILDQKLEIDEVKLGDLTEQYIEKVKEQTQLDLDDASYFIFMMAILLEIKTNKLLPKEEEEEQADEEDAEYLLQLMLKEYAIFKEVSTRLEEIEEIGRYFKPTDKVTKKFRLVLNDDDLTLEGMLDAFAQMLIKADIKKQEELKPKEIEKDRFTVADKIDTIQQTIIDKKEVKFKSLFEEDFTKSEVITVFLAVLELLKRHVLKAEQSSTFEDIDLLFNEESYKNNEVLTGADFEDYK